MLWPLVIPVKITFWAILGLILLATLVTPLFKRAYPVFLISLVAGMVLFVPSCAVIKHFVDAQRFGIFQYTIGSEISDDHVERWIPKTAKNVTVDQQWTGFRAKYEIESEELKAFMDDQWRTYGKYAIITREDHASADFYDAKIGAEEFDFHYRDLNWPPLEDAVEHYGPHAGNGAGFVIWYSAKQKIAYQKAGYW